MPEGYASFCQIVWRQLNGHLVTCEDPDVVLSHLAGQVGQYFVTVAYLNLEGGITHTFNYGSIDWDHIFFGNNVTSFPRRASAGAYAPRVQKLKSRTSFEYFNYP